MLAIDDIRLSRLRLPGRCGRKLKDRTTAHRSAASTQPPVHGHGIINKAYCRQHVPVRSAPVQITAVSIGSPFHTKDVEWPADPAWRRKVLVRKPAIMLVPQCRYRQTVRTPGNDAPRQLVFPRPFNISFQSILQNFRSKGIPV